MDHGDKPLRGRRGAGAREDDDRGGVGSSDDLRYEGPISFDDVEDNDDNPIAAGGGRVFLTASVIGGAVILLVAVALWLRGGADSKPALALNKPDRAPTSAEPAQRAALPPGNDVPAGEPGGAPPQSPNSPAPGAVDARAALAAPSTQAPIQQVERRAEPAGGTLPPPLVERPTPLQARDVAPAPSAPPPREAGAVDARPAAPRPARLSGPATRPRGDGATGDQSLRSAVEAGDLTGAAEAGGRVAREAGAGAYSLQLVFACEESTVRKAFAAVKQPELFLVRAKPSGRRTCYRLLWGQYGSRQEALAGVNEIPEYFRRGGTPFPFALGKISTP